MKFPTGSDEVSQHQIIFFSFGDGTVKSIAPEAVLIIPATGELVVDNLQSSTSNTQVFRAAKEDPSFRHVWQSAFARNAAEFFSRPERTDEGTVA